MKTKKRLEKLVLFKETISNLDNVRGGLPETNTCDDDDTIVPTNPTISEAYSICCPDRTKIEPCTGPILP